MQLFVLPTRILFTSFAQSVLAVFFTMSVSAPGKFLSSNTGVFVQCSGQHNVLPVVDT